MPFDCTGDNRSAIGAGSCGSWPRGGPSTGCGSGARSPLPPEPLAFEPAAPKSEQPEAVAIEQELADRLRLAVGRASRSRGKRLLAALLRRDANSDIAETLGISADAVGVALHKARKRLKELLGLQEVTQEGDRRS